MRLFLLQSCFVSVAVFMPVYGMPSDPCTSGWPVDEVQTQFTCNINQVGMWMLQNLSYAFVPAAIGVILFLSCPFFYCGRYYCDCCGGDHQRPGYCCCGGQHWDDKSSEEKCLAYSAAEIRMVRYGSIAMLLVPVGYFSAAYFGGTQLLQTINQMVNGANSVIDLFRSDVETLGAELGVYNGTFPSYIAPFGSSYSDVLNNLNNIQQNYVDNSLVTLSKTLVGAFAYMTLVPALFMGIGAISALLLHRKCFPMLTAAFLFLLSLPFGVASSLFMIATAPVDVACAEINAQLERQPGLFQNYLVPNCDMVNPIAKLNTSIQSSVAEIARNACSTMRSVCSTSSDYQVDNYAQYWECSFDPIICQSLNDVNALLSSMHLKAYAPDPCGGTNQSNPCTLEQCLTECPANSTAQLAAMTVLQDISDLQNISIAINNSTLYVDYPTCNDLIDFIIASIPLCDHAPTALTTVSIAFMLVVFGNIAGITFMVLGSKRFFDRERYDNSNAVFGEHYRNMNSASTVRRADTSTRNINRAPSEQQQPLLTLPPDTNGSGPQNAASGTEMQAV